MKLKPSRTRKRGRIEIIPMIDVMFFLLATFMLASLAMQNLHSLRVDLPRGETSQLQIGHTPTLTVTRDGHVLVNETETSLDDLPDRLGPLATDGVVVVNADSDAPHGVVVEAMLRARTAGVERFLFALRKK
ncbi:MAG TPA: biopolymer transporter ExbD [Magnetospirillaceae bacterium]|jgi:biopolymer transport protein ExbD